MQLSQVDLTDPDVFARGAPFETFALLRREAPVFWHEERDGPGFWAVTKYADLKHASRHPEIFSSESRGTMRHEPNATDLGFMRAIMLNMDPPRHRHHRALVSKAFTKRRCEALRPRVRALVDEILDGVIERGECEFVDEVAAILPMEVICDLMGVPAEERRHIVDIGNRMVSFDDPEVRPDLEAGDREIADAESKRLSAEMFLYASKLRERALAEPADDLATALVQAELDGEKLTPEEFQFFFLLLLVAGNETTRTVTSNGLLALLDHPDQLARVREDPSLVPSAVEEILRYAPAIHSFRRQTTCDTELRGVRMEPDQKVMLWYPSANRDEDVFPEPERFDVTRHPNEHLAFGVGEHYCLGASLARLELQEIFGGILSRLHEIELAAPPRRLRSTFVNGVKELRLRFRPGPRVGSAAA